MVAIYKIKDGFLCEKQHFKSITALLKYIRPALKAEKEIKPTLSINPTTVSKINRGVFYGA